MKIKMDVKKITVNMWCVWLNWVDPLSNRIVSFCSPIYWKNDKWQITPQKEFFLRKKERKCRYICRSKNKSPVLISLLGLTWLFVGGGKIFDFGILWIIFLEMCFFMSITSEPINVMYTHMSNRMLSFLKWSQVCIAVNLIFWKLKIVLTAKVLSYKHQLALQNC